MTIIKTWGWTGALTFSPFLIIVKTMHKLSLYLICNKIAICIHTQIQTPRLTVSTLTLSWCHNAIVVDNIQDSFSYSSLACAAKSLPLWQYQKEEENLLEVSSSINFDPSHIVHLHLSKCTYMKKIPNQYKYIQRYAKIYQWRIPNFMTNMECRITNQNQCMNIVIHRHFKSINISKYETK